MLAIKRRTSRFSELLASWGSEHLNLLLLSNIVSLYFFLFWDSLARQIPALSGGPADSLFLKTDRFMDWINTLHSAGLIRPYGIENQVAMPVYGPLTYLILKPVAMAVNTLSPSAEMSVATSASMLWLVITAIVLIFFIRHVQTLRAALNPGSKSVSLLLLASTILLGYPFIFAFDRGNLELITLALVGWYLALACQDRTDHVKRCDCFLSIRKSDLVLALAVCIKPYTLLFALCSANDKRSSSRSQLCQVGAAAARVLGVAIFLTVLSLGMLYEGNISQGYSELAHWQQKFRAAYIVGTAGDLFYCSPFIAIKTILYRMSAPDWLISDFILAYPVAALAYCGLAFMAILRSPYRHTWRKEGLTTMLTAISVMLLLFPFNANEYKAIYALLPFIVAYSVPDNAANAPLGHPFPQARSNFISPQSLSIALCFVLLVNRYGFTGIGATSSLIASICVAIFPILLLRVL